MPDVYDVITTSHDGGRDSRPPEGEYKAMSKRGADKASLLPKLPRPLRPPSRPMFEDVGSMRECVDELAPLASHEAA